MVIKQASQVIVMDGHLWQPQQLNFPTTTYPTLPYNTFLDNNFFYCYDTLTISL